MEQKEHLRLIVIFLSIFCLCAVVASFKLLSSVFMPLTVAILLSLVFYPLCRKLNKLRIPWVVCVLIIIALAIIAIYIVGQLLVTSLSAVIASYPRYESKFTSIYQSICETFGIQYDYENTLWNNLVNSLNVRSALQSLAISLSSGLVTFVKTLLVVGLFVAFFLIEMPTLNKKMELMFAEQHKRSKLHLMAKKTIAEVTHYISIKFFISLITGILVGLSTFVIHMDFPIIWGFIAFTLNFIPSFGSIISWTVTTLFAVLQFYPHWGYAVYVGFMVLAINMILGNVIEPRWEGSDLGISPFMILVSLSFFGWMWGFVGMIMAVPLMVIIKIMCENNEHLSSFAILIGNGTPKSKKKKWQTRREEKQHAQKDDTTAKEITPQQ